MKPQLKLTELLEMNQTMKVKLLKTGVKTIMVTNGI